MVSGEDRSRAFFIGASRIALRASPQAEGPLRWISFRKIHALTFTGTCYAGRQIPFDTSVVTVNEVSV